jgi:hypothetical protein
MSRRNIHTVYNNDASRWENKEEGNKTPLSTHQKKDNALDRGEKMAEEANVEHFIHGKDGKIQERNSYGNDPFPPRG